MVAFNAISSYHNRKEDFSWDIVWPWKGPQSIYMFLWLVTHNRLKTKAELARRHILADVGCECFGCGVKDTLHVLRDCMVVKRLWHRFVPVEALQFFFDPPLKEWLQSNLTSERKLVSGLKWTTFLGVAIWHLWFWRNQFQFEGGPIGSMSLVNDIMARDEEIHRLNTSSLGMTHRKIEGWIRWSAPSQPRCKLNIDGALKSNGAASVGGLVRDHNGTWIVGFGINIGHCSVTLAEFWGLFHGLNTAWQHGIRRVMVEIDSQCVVQLVQQSQETTNEYTPLVRSIRELLQHDWHVTLHHVYREANSAVGFLANFALS